MLTYWSSGPFVKYKQLCVVGKQIYSDNVYCLRADVILGEKRVEGMISNN